MSKKIEEITVMPPDLRLLLTLMSLNYPMSLTYFHGSQGVRAIEVQQLSERMP